MSLFKTFKIISGILLIISSITIFALLFLEPDTLAVMITFDLDITAGNLAEAIAGIAVGIAAALFYMFLIFFLGVLNFIMYAVIGGLTLGLKSKVVLIIDLIITAVGIFLESRTIFILLVAELNSLVLTVRLISDIIIVLFASYCLFELFHRPEAY